MKRLTCLAVAGLGMSAVNIVLRVWVIVPLEWDLEPEWFPVSVGSKNETTYQPDQPRPFRTYNGSRELDPNLFSNPTPSVDSLRRENERLKYKMQCLEGKASWWGC